VRAEGSDARTISRLVDAGHRYRIKLTSGDQVTDVDTSMSFCTNPECTCRELELFLEPADEEAGWAEPHRKVRAVINLDTGEILDLTERCTAAFRETLDSLLSVSLLDYLRERWRRVKLKHDPDAWRQQDWSWWEPGLMVRWLDAFPGDFDTVVDVEGRRYVVDDQYCCKPRCTCDEVVLTFCAVGEKNRKPATPYVNVDLSKWRASDVGGPLSQEQLALWQACSAVPGIKATLRERRRQLRAVGRELYREAEGLPARPPQAKTTEAKTTEAKVGRNAPCPCGSGKKYKKCCANV
jgi:hypothetical protein